MKKLLLLLTFVAISSLMGLSKLQATHALASDIYYEPIGQDSFIVRVNLFRDCAGIQVPNTIQINLIGCNLGPFNYALELIGPVIPNNYIQGTEVSPLCPNFLPLSTCNNGSIMGVQHYQYSGLIVLRDTCPDWKIWYSETTRNAATTNLLDPAAYDLYIEATINNTNGIQNTSSAFRAPTVPYFCYQENVSYNLLAYDAEGDSLVYNFIQPMVAFGTPATYVSGYSLSNPLSCNNTFLFDNLNGQISFVPQTPQVAVIAIRIDEYRNGVLVGSTMRDMELIVLGSPVCSPPYNSPASAVPFNVTGGNLVSSTQLETCMGDTLRFSLAFTAPSPGYFENIQNSVPGASYVATSLGLDSFRLDITWPVNSAGQKNFLLSYGTSSCPITRSINSAYYINVISGISANSDISYCPGGQPAQLNCTGGAVYTWSPTTGLSNPNISNPMASPTATTIYTVQSNLGNNCINTDTVKVTVVPSFVYSFIPNTDTISFCSNNIAQLSVEPDSTFGPYVYSWSPSIGLSSTQTPSTFASPNLSTTYTVAITSDTGCTILDSIRINITGNGPKVTISPDQSVLCADSNLQLNVSISPLSCGASSTSCAANLIVAHSYIGSNSGPSVTTPFYGTASDSRFQTLFLASDLLATGMTSGTISKLRFVVVSKGSNAPYENLTIRLGCTNESSLNRISWQPNMVEVFSTPSYNTVAGDNDFTLTQNYDWDGVSNLVLEVCYGSSNNNALGGNDTLLSAGVTYLATMAATSQNAPDGCSIPAHAINIGPTYIVPLVTFYSCDAVLPAYTYQWTPSAGLSNPNILSPIASPLVNTSYLLTIDDGTCTGQDMANIRINNFSVSVTQDTVLCASDTVQLNAVVSGIFQTNIPCSANGNYCDGNVDSTEVGMDSYYNTNTLYPAPYGHFYQSARQQYLYTAADLLAAGVTPGRITALAFNLKAISGIRYYYGFSIKIKCTSSTELLSNTFETGQFTEVFYPKPVTLPNFPGWIKHEFDNAFDWDGTTNLLIELCFDNNPYAPSFSANSAVYYTDASYNASVWSVSDVTSMCSNTTQQVIVGPSTRRPNIKLYSCTPGLPYNVSWSPSMGLDNTNINNPVATPTTTTQYKVLVTGPGGCSKLDSVTIYVNDSAKISITSNPATICPGSGVVTFMATAIIGGPSPTFQWFLNGNMVGSNLPSLSLSSLAANDSIWCEMRSNASCINNSIAISNVITVVGSNNNVANVTILANPNPVCAGSSNNVFTAIPVNGGTSPTYQWTVNGNNVGTNTNTYIANNLNAYDTVRCTITSSVTCLSTGTATSNDVVVRALDTLSVLIATNQSILPCASNNSISFTAYPINAGTNTTYQWYLNNNTIGTNSDTLWLTNIMPNDVIKCVVTSVSPCNINSSSTSDEMILVCVGINDLIANLAINVQPNPSSGLFHINAKGVGNENWVVTVYDIAGKEIYNQAVAGSLQQHPIDLSTIGKGVYILQISNGSQQGHKRLVVY